MGVVLIIKAATRHANLHEVVVDKKRPVLED